MRTNTDSVGLVSRKEKKFYVHLETRVFFFMSPTTSNLFVCFFFFTFNLTGKQYLFGYGLGHVSLAILLPPPPRVPNVINHRCVMAMTHDTGAEKKNKTRVQQQCCSAGDYELLIGVVVITRKVPGMSKNSRKMNTNAGFQRAYDGEI